MKKITMNYVEYKSDLSAENIKGYNAGMRDIVLILEKRRKGASDEDLLQLINEMELHFDDRNRLIKALGIVEPEFTEADVPF